MQPTNNETNSLLQYQMQKDAERRKFGRTAGIVAVSIVGGLILICLCISLIAILFFGGSIWMMFDSLGNIPGI